MRFGSVGFGLLLVVSGCGYSLVEHSIRADIPATFRDHTSGIALTPSDADVQEAVALGRQSKDGKALMYAYLAKANRPDPTYIYVATPLYLIAAHARLQARDYRELDSEFVACIRVLNAVRLSMIEQYTYGAHFGEVQAFDRQVTLLRDGTRVVSLKEIKTCRGRNPFLSTESVSSSEVAALVVESAAKYTRPYFATMTEEQKALTIRNYKAAGFSEAQIASMTGQAPPAGDLGASGAPQMVTLSEVDAVFSAEELNRPGNYEVIFRTPPSTGLFHKGDEEIRMPISFAGFR